MLLNRRRHILGFNRLSFFYFLHLLAWLYYIYLTSSYIILSFFTSVSRSNYFIIICVFICFNFFYFSCSLLNYHWVNKPQSTVTFNPINIVGNRGEEEWRLMVGKVPVSFSNWQMFAVRVYLWWLEAKCVSGITFLWIRAGLAPVCQSDSQEVNLIDTESWGSAHRQE